MRVGPLTVPHRRHFYVPVSRLTADELAPYDGETSDVPCAHCGRTRFIHNRTGWVCRKCGTPRLTVQ